MYLNPATVYVFSFIFHFFFIFLESIHFYNKNFEDRSVLECPLVQLSQFLKCENSGKDSALAKVYNDVGREVWLTLSTCNATFFFIANVLVFLEVYLSKPHKKLAVKILLVLIVPIPSHILPSSMFRAVDQIISGKMIIILI